MGEFPNKVTQFTRDNQPSKNGRPKGSRNLRNVIQELMEDENFELKLKDGKILKGTPSRHVSETMYKLAVSGNTKAADWLARHGYSETKAPEGNTYNTQINVSEATPRGAKLVDNFMTYIASETKAPDEPTAE